MIKEKIVQIQSPTIHVCFALTEDGRVLRGNTRVEEDGKEIFFWQEVTPIKN